MDKKTVLKLKNIHKTYHLGKDLSLHVLKGIDLEIKNREMVALMGSSGSGKSTLMHIIGFLSRPDKGSYFFEGQKVNAFDDDKLAEIRNRKIGFVFQSFHLLARATALENVELPLLYGGIESQERKERAAKILTKLGLGDRLDHRPNELSGGQKQRVAIARALVTKPAILLADEPTGNLDSQTSREIMKLFEELNANGQTILMVTHEIDVAQYMHKVIFMKDGLLADECIDGCDLSNKVLEIYQSDDMGHA